jgi:hypothetical protein
MNAAQHQFNPSELSSDQLDRIAFAVAGKLKFLLESETLYTKQEAADFLKISYKTFERRLNSGHYPNDIVHKDGGTMLFVKSELVKHVKSLRS